MTGYITKNDFFRNINIFQVVFPMKHNRLLIYLYEIPLENITQIPSYPKIQAMHSIPVKGKQEWM